MSFVSGTAFESLVNAASAAGLSTDDKMKQLAANIEKRFTDESQNLKEGKATLVCLITTLLICPSQSHSIVIVSDCKHPAHLEIIVNSVENYNMFNSSCRETV